MSKASGGSGVPALILVMGVAGSGKSTIARMLAERLGWSYVDADWLHPTANIDKMSRGIALEDADRWPWLKAIAARIDTLHAEGASAVIACSALKRAYREVLVRNRAARVVYLRGDRETVARRLPARPGHFMPASLLESQFAALEEPQAGEHPIVVAIERAPVEIVETILSRLA